MAKTIRNAYKGFAAFERELIKIRHVGWVRWISEREFVLKKSPYRDNLIENCSYLAPSDLHPPSNAFIEVEVDRYERQYRNLIKDSAFVDYKDRYRVSNINYININKILDIAKPYLNSDEFRYRITYNWDNADSDKLDWALPLQILSCAESVYGIGGIGTVTLSLAGSSRKPLKDLKSSIIQILPEEFIKGNNNKYFFGFIENKTTLLDIKKMRKERKITEISYNHLWKLPPDSALTPIQIATTLQNAEYKPRSKELDPDVLEYLLTALLINPPVEDRMISDIENDIKNIYKTIHPDRDYSSLPFDHFSTIKIANSFCRLELKDKLEDTAFSKARAIFRDLSHTFLEAKDDLIGTKTTRETWDIPNVEVSYLDKWRSSTDTEVLRTISKISKQYGQEWVKISEILQYAKNKDLNLDDITVRDSLSRLNNLGIIINLDNGTRYKIIKHD